jgi:glucose-6-phosphate 1-epimerase
VDQSLSPALSERFGIANALRFEGGSGGLTRASISTAAAEAEVFLQGAHLTRWTPAGQRPVLFLSPASGFAPGKAIRGGVPIIFPWFGPKEGQAGSAHGFARTMPWDVESTGLRDDGAVEIALTLKTSDIDLRFRVTVGTELVMALEVRNEGVKPLRYEEALHTYFAAGDIHQVSVTGLEGTIYVDKTDGFQRKQADAQPIRIEKETDQVHLNTSGTCLIHDPAWHRRIVIDKAGSESTVVWNPWMEKCGTMADLAADSWGRMLCVESGNIAENAISLDPGASHRLTVTVRVEPAGA